MTTNNDLDVYLGSWAFQLPDGHPAWLNIQPDSSISFLWSVGSAKPAGKVSLENGVISFQQNFSWRPYGKGEWRRVTLPITGKMNKADQLVITVLDSLHDEQGKLVLEGKRMPPLPSAPDLSKLTFGESIDLLANGLYGWRLTNPDKMNGWRFENGVLINETPKSDFSAYGDFGNLRTIRNFMDFELSIDYNIPENGNSGIYLRGAYEAQVVDRDSPMQGIIGPGSIFGRIAPIQNAGKSGGEWNHYRLLLVDRHITVELNGKIVIDNAPLQGCTGGGINADDTAPGPIFLQGDHTSVQYRNIILRPVIR